MIKFKLRYISICLLLIAFTSCDFLDTDESSDYTKEDVYQSKDRNKRAVTHIYSFLPDDFMSTGGGMHESATDNAVHVYNDANIQRFVNGTWSANYVVDNVWSHYYEGIRAANMYLIESKDQIFEEWMFNDDYEAFMKEFKNYQFEVRFLRAYYYFELIKRYQNVPFTTEIYEITEVNKLTPKSFKEVAQFIVEECEDLSKQLPKDYSKFASQESGRVTTGVAMALKSRVLLYMASPLFNPSNDKDLWKEAARASLEFISKSEELGYQLDKYPALFRADNNKSKEVILCRPVGETGNFEKANFPIGIEGGRTSTCPTQNLMEAYESKDGTPFVWTDTDGKVDPYANRDPRLKFTIACNNMKWPTNNDRLEVWEGGANAVPLKNASVTGYYLKKYVNSEISFTSDSKVTKKHHNWVLFRYAEILLNYAEAMVNAFENPYYTDAELPLSAAEAVNKVRARDGVEMPNLPEGLGADEFKKRLENERRVEFAFEGHRFWDIRRNQKLHETSNIYGVKVIKENEEFKYRKFLLEKRLVEDKMYFYPISNVELNKNANLIQNTGW